MTRRPDMDDLRRREDLATELAGDVQSPLRTAEALDIEEIPEGRSFRP